MANSTSIVFGPQTAGVGNKHTYAVKMSIDTYSAGGVAIALPKSLGKTVVPVIANVSGGYSAFYNASTGKVMLYSTAGTEVSSLGSAVTVEILFVGQ